MMTDPAPADQTPRPRRRWWSLSVRGLMILVLAVGGAIGWEINRVRRMREAVAVLERDVAVPFVPIHGVIEILYDDTYFAGQFVDDNRWAWLPGWVREQVGEDHFRRVTSVGIARRPEPADWDALAALGAVERLDLAGPDMTDADLVGIDRCRSLRNVEVFSGGESAITGKSLPALARLPALRDLNLRGSQVRPADLAALADLAGLETLELPAGAGTDAGLAHLRKLANLRKLTAGRVSDLGLAQLLAAHPRLETFWFEPEHLTDAGMATLARFPRLTGLSLGDWFESPAPGPARPEIALTAAGLGTLAGMVRLEALSINDDAVDATLLGAVARLVQLQSLRLQSHRIADADLALLRPLVNLEFLRINSPLVTNAGLLHLKPLIKLRDLNLVSRADDAGIAAIRPFFPKLRSAYGFDFPTSGDGVSPAPPP